LLAVLPRVAAAQPVDPPPAATDLDELRPPVLEKRATATYPEEAKRDRLEANVGLELVVGDDGHVEEAKVTSPAGHGFDEAAIEAARSFVFAPATQGGKPIRSSVQFTYEFHLPPEVVPPPAPPPVAVVPPPPPPAEIVQTGADQSTLVLAQRPISAASSSTVRDREFSLRPIGSVQDILRVTPGLVLVQHSGGGKANQYFLRGFDADHGTDLALSIDGIPINMVSHAHGQGFSDTNFIIPEVVERVEITKGPYFANQGDFATAGAVNMVSRDSFEHSSVGFGLSGSPGHGALGYRGLLIASPKFESGLKATFAAEVGRQNGPFDNPENWDKYKLFNKLTYDITPSSSITLGEMSYGGAWHGSGQIPARAVEQGTVSRFGSIDPDEGGYTSRHQLFVQYKVRPSDNSEVKALAYVGAYNFNLFSNFTLFERDPENGDEIEQVDRRTFYGGRLSYRVVHEIEGMRFDTTLGGDARNDDIHEELWNTQHRIQLGQVRGNDVHETMIGAYANEEFSPVKYVRANFGTRADVLAFAVDNRLATTDPGAPRSGVDSAHQLSPKASLIVSPLMEQNAQLDLYLNYGHGFHSNDVRGAFSTPAVTPLTRAIGSELGARTRLFDRWDFAAAFWQLNLKNETVWNGDDGTTAVGDATNRHGIELESRYELTKWLSVDGDVTFTKSQFSTDGENGGGLALAPKQTYSGGVSVRHQAGPGVARGGLRFYGITDRPASDDGVLIAPGFTIFDLHAGYRLRRFDIALDVENLFNQDSRSAQFATVGRLRNEPAIGAPVPAGFNCGSNGRLASDPAIPAGRFAGCEDVHFTPQYPTTLRVMATVFLD
jgi:TonB family protein